MSFDTLINLLRDYGFSEKEAKIYLTCLEFGEDMPSSISRRAGENRITTYSILKDLSKKGLANEITKNNKKFYSVISPDKLVKKQEEKYLILKNNMPELLAVTNQYAHKPSFYYYEGFQGIKEIFEDQLGSKELSSFFGRQDAGEEFEDYMDNYYIKELKKRKIYTKVLMKKEDGKAYVGNYIKNNLNKLGLLDNKFFNMGADDITIYSENKVSISTYTKTTMSGIIIENKNFYSIFKGLFDMLRDMYYK